MRLIEQHIQRKLSEKHMGIFKHTLPTSIRIEVRYSIWAAYPKVYCRVTI